MKDNSLTKIDRHKLIFIQKFLQKFPVDFLNLILRLEDVLRGEPGEDHLAVHEVAVVDDGRHPPEVDEGGGVVDVVLPRRVGVVVLDEVDAVRVGFVVDLLKAFQDRVTLNALIVV